MSLKDESLFLRNQICFPLYAASRLTTKLYGPLLEEFDITYPQYLTLLILWEEDHKTVSQISELLMLESNTLTPLLKRMEQKGLITRERAKDDERKVFITLTDEGNALKQKAICIPEQIMSKFSDETQSQEQILSFKQSLDKIVKLLNQ